jgi:hypothetical protein
MHRPGKGSPGLLAEMHRLRDVIKECEAIYVAQIPDRVFTHELLIGAIAAQIGGAHEAEGLDYALVMLNQFLLNHQQLYVRVLAFDAELTLQIGERVLDHAERHHAFRRAPRSRHPGDVTLCIRFARSHFLACRVPLITLRSEISEAEITCSAGPQSTVFTLKKRGALVDELRAPYPADWDMNADALFTLSYSSTHRQARTITNNEANAPPIECALGWLDARELRPQLLSGCEDLVVLRCIPVYDRLLSPAECGELLAMSVDGRELLVHEPTVGPFPA